MGVKNKRPTWIELYVHVRTGLRKPADSFWTFTIGIGITKHYQSYSIELFPPFWIIPPLVSQHFWDLDRENFGDSNYSLPLEMIIFEGKSVQNTSRMLKIFACGAYWQYFWRKMDIILIIYCKSTAPKAPKFFGLGGHFMNYPPLVSQHFETRGG